MNSHRFKWPLLKHMLTDISLKEKSFSHRNSFPRPLFILNKRPVNKFLYQDPNLGWMNFYKNSSKNFINGKILSLFLHWSTISGKTEDKNSNSHCSDHCGDLIPMRSIIFSHLNLDKNKSEIFVKPPEFHRMIFWLSWMMNF